MQLLSLHTSCPFVTVTETVSVVLIIESVCVILTLACFEFVKVTAYIRRQRRLTAKSVRISCFFIVDKGRGAT